MLMNGERGRTEGRKPVESTEAQWEISSRQHIVEVRRVKKGDPEITVTKREYEKNGGGFVHIPVAVYNNDQSIEVLPYELVVYEKPVEIEDPRVEERTLRRLAVAVRDNYRIDHIGISWDGQASGHGYAIFHFSQGNPAEYETVGILAGSWPLGHTGVTSELSLQFADLLGGKTRFGYNLNTALQTLVNHGKENQPQGA